MRGASLGRPGVMGCSGLDCVVEALGGVSFDVGDHGGDDSFLAQGKCPVPSRWTGGDSGRRRLRAVYHGVGKEGRVAPGRGP